MGCGSSKITMVRPVERNGCEDAFGKTDAFSRGDSAVSKLTTDSGVGLEAGEGAGPLCGAQSSLSPLQVPRFRLDPSLSPALENADRQTSTDILEQLRNQGILLAPPTVGGAGEAYSVMMDGTDRVLRKPPARLQSLKTSKEQTVSSMETIEAKMKSVEERRKVKEAELRQRLRSARLRGSANLKEEELEEEEEGRVPDHPTPGLDGAELETDSTFLQAPHQTEEAF